MKKTMFSMVVIALMLLIGADAALAGKFARQQAAQQERIQEGICSGRLTGAEARLLKQEQRHIRKVKKRFMADGVMVKAERRKLSALQKRADHHIRRLKRNQKRTPPRHLQGARQKTRHLHVATGHLQGHPV